MMKGCMALLFLVATLATAQDQPRVYVTASSKGSNWNARRDQSIEMTKDFQKQCPDVRVTTIAEKADYSVTLSHIEHGFARDNQIEVSNRDGDVLETREKGSIKNNVKNACDLILGDWRKGNHSTSAGESRNATPASSVAAANKQ
jgi:hypothetical protein